MKRKKTAKRAGTRRPRKTQRAKKSVKLRRKPKVSGTPAAKKLVAAALVGRTHSYSPYSRYKVGAAIRTASGKTYLGCNVENSTYGATVCAERVAVTNAVAAEGAGMRIAEVAVVTDATPPWPPCGICRQVLAEFITDPQNTPIHTGNLKGYRSTTTLADLLPSAFLPKHLKRKK